MTRPFRIAITTGDTDGIGLEIAAKALSKIGPKSGFQFYVWRSHMAQKKDLRRLDSKFKRLTVTSWPEALRVSTDSHKTLIDIASTLTPPHWVELSAQAAMFGHIDALATAPLSKTIIQSAGMTDIGHTDILKRVSKARSVFMAFVGDQFSVLLATGHIGISMVHAAVTSDRLEAAIKHAYDFKQKLGSKSQKPIAVLGLNPHAGEQGIIGSEELSIHTPLIEKLSKEGFEVAGPIPPDIAFKKENLKKYSIFVANYHDQGLIPFKMIHGQSGVHISLGLPFIRTSVDHGTAKDIFGKNKADPQSMYDSLKWAMQMLKRG